MTPRIEFLTIEDVIAHSPGTTHTMNVQFTIAY